MGGHDTENPLQTGKTKLDLSYDPTERLGLTSERAEELTQEFGYNELPEITISIWWVLFVQFTGVMPYMLELAALIAIAVQDYADFGIILVMLLCNGFLGFHEQMKAAESLRELTQKMEQKIATLRDGHAENLLTRLLVPGDVVLLIGGVQVPADIEWLEGDILQVDTAALTGEPLPRKYPCEEYGKLILCGATIRSGEAYGIVRKTGVNTEIGSANADIMKDKTVTKVSVFEQRVLMVVQVVIFVALIDVLIIFIVQGVVQDQFTASGIQTDLLTCLSIIVAAIPIALPIVLNVTMALGAGKMAREYDAVVTSLPALQDISSMTVLCSDKTGTLTTAKISIHAESVWCAEGFTKQDVALYAGLASNRDKKEDAIDRSVINHFDRIFNTKGADIVKEYTKVRSVGFNPIYKRVLYEYTHPKIGNIIIAKGLPTKVLNTKDGGEDDAADQWVCEGFEQIKDVVKKVDYDFSKAGYKTLGIVVKINNKPWTYCGILPMLDPPRHDTAQTIKNLVTAGINVKMITGDHLNIAKETARLIGMGINIHAGEETRNPTQDRNELVWNADGFAQVLPKDKREVVLVLRNIYNQVVGMTGDGVNDAPALSAAQCGVAVDDATDAAKNAAAIILTSPGLSAIYSAVVESRRIFRKLKAYVTYRFAASIQIVVVLTLLIFISNCPITALFIILLALFNDLTMLPIAYDFQQASTKPENPDVTNILTVSASLGTLETCFTLLFAYGAGPSGIFQGDYQVTGNCSVSTQGAIWLQMFVATELLIFSARAPTYIWASIAPSLPLFASVITGCLIASLMAGLSTTFGAISGLDIVLIWVYNIICLFFIDVTKVSLFKFFNENTEVLPEVVETGSVSEKVARARKSGEGEFGNTPDQVTEDYSRASISTSRLSEWALSKNEHLSNLEPSRESIAAATRSKSKNAALSSIDLYRESLTNGRISVSRSMTTPNGDLRPSFISSSANLRPNTPAAKAIANRK